MFHFEPIGVLQTCFKEKFGVPRQPGLVPSAIAILKLRNDPFFKSAVREIEKFSHLWIVFVFHQHDAKSWKPSIRPPRLGGRKKVGVLASRSPHRPNPIGLSCVKLEKIDVTATGGIELHLSGVDCLDGTPVLDIKPYLPYCDSIPDASSGWAPVHQERITVHFSEKALQIMGSEKASAYPQLQTLIREILELDPRPAFQQKKLPTDAPHSEGTLYGFRLFCFDVQWGIKDHEFHVLDLIELN
jgi:tRNA-Thr(GGU) m(6)t(6)A37 methyltransferase TsaA